MVDVPLAATPSGVDESAWLAACAAVRGYCGWHVAPVVEETVTMDGSGGNLMFLPTLRLLALTSITNDGETVDDPEWSAMGIVRGSWTGKFRGVVAEMEHGYEACPADLLAVLAELAANPAALRGVASVTSGPHSFSLEPAMSESQRRTLDAYRIASLA